jgi:hypothetical protein
MPNNKLEMHGLEELREALRRLPEELAREAEDIIDNRGELAMAEIIQSYPRRTGNLRKGVRIRNIAGRGRRVTSNAFHAHLYERGTKLRRTKRGWNRGRMPARPTVVPVAIRHRRLMEQELVDLLVRHGFIVTRT